jgi:hypothetical protein
VSCCAIGSILDARVIGFAIWGDRVTRVLDEKSGHDLVRTTPLRRRVGTKSTTPREGVVTFGIANFPNAQGWDAERFSMLLRVPWPVLAVKASNTSPALFITSEPFVFAASLARNNRTR